MRIGSIHIDVPLTHLPVSARRRWAHSLTLEFYFDAARAWDADCGGICGDGFQFASEGGAPARHAMANLPHLDEALKAVLAEYAANRGNPVGAFLRPAVEAMEKAVAQRDGASVYFAAAGDRIKIGWSRKVGTRIAQLQTGNPEPVVLLATVPGGLSRERALHRRFDHLRVAGEWFAAAPELTAYIAAIDAKLASYATEEQP